MITIYSHYGNIIQVPYLKPRVAGRGYKPLGVGGYARVECRDRRSTGFEKLGFRL